MNPVIDSQMNVKPIQLFFLSLVFFVGFSSCRKTTDEKFDNRDAIVGKYEVIDSMFRFVNLDTSTGLWTKQLDKIYRHPLVIASKGTFFTNDKTWESGVLFTIKQRDSSSHHFDNRGFVKDKVFIIEGSSGGGRILTQLDGPTTGVFKNNEIFAEYNTVFPHEYSRSHLKRLP